MKVKRWILFICAAALLQGVMLLFCTEGGLMLLYPAVVRTGAESYQTSGAYTVYYDMRIPVTEADWIVVGMDFGVVQSYEAFQHFFRFVKQYKNITAVLLDEMKEYVPAVTERMNNIFASPEMPAVLMDFADVLAAINDTMPPIRKFTVEASGQLDARTVGGGNTIVLMDRDKMMEQKAELEEAGALCVEMKYMNCPTAEGNMRNDIRLPFAGQGERFYFLPASRIEWFYSYFSRVTNLLKQNETEESASRLEQVSADYVICIAGGTAAEMQTAETEAVP